jgi:hypothetical protein
MLATTISCGAEFPVEGVVVVTTRALLEILWGDRLRCIHRGCSAHLVMPLALVSGFFH